MALEPIDLARSPRTGREWAARQVLTVGATVVALAPPANVIEAVVQVQANPVRMTMDQSDPSATSGAGWDADDWFRLTGMDDIRVCRFVREGAANGTLEVNYFVERD